MINPYLLNLPCHNTWLFYFNHKNLATMITLKVVYRFLENKRLKKDGTAPIYILAYQTGGERRYFKTGICISPKQWNPEKRIVNHPRKRELNTQLRNQLNEMESFILEKEKRSLPINLQILGDYSHSQIDLSFSDFYFDQVQTTSTNTGTIRDQMLTLTYLKEIKPIIYFNELKKALIHRFEAHLLKKELAVNTIAKHHKNLKKYINRAIDFEYLDMNKNPYRGFKVKRQQTERVFLRQQEVDKLENLTFKPEERFLELTRDFFLFCCWTGLRKSDATELKHIHLVETNEGLVYQKMSRKTKKPHYLSLHKLFGGKPERLMQRYLKEYEDIYFDDPDNIVPIFMGKCNQVLNRQLKTIASLAGLRIELQEKISIHIARHTFGTIMVQKVPLNVVQRLMQHSNIRETQIYLHLVESMVNDALDRVKDWG